MTNERCRSCGAEIRFVLSEKGKRIPIDPWPAENGNLIPVVIKGEGQFGIDKIMARVVGPDHVGPKWISHFATCPNAAQHRRRTR